MITPSSVSPTEDAAPISWAPWLTARRLTFFVIGWLALFAAGSVFVSSPFQTEPAAGVTPNYFNVMYMHGLLIGMVGLLALLTLQVMKVSSIHVRIWITGGVMFATVLAAVGGIFDTRIPGAEVAMWTQILGSGDFVLRLVQRPRAGLELVVTRDQRAASGPRTFVRERPTSLPRARQRTRTLLTLGVEGKL